MNPLMWLNPGRWLLMLAACAALIAGYFFWEDRVGDKREASVRAELKALADAQTERNRELQRAAEKRYTVAAETRERVIVETITELRDAIPDTPACVIPERAVKLLNQAAACAAGAGSACGEAP